jgi:lipopolysaccharide biosynthesis regulator YciM
VDDYAQSALACAEADAARARLLSLFETLPSLDLLRALERLHAAPPLLPYLRQHATLSAAQQWLAQPASAWTEEGVAAVRAAIARNAAPLQRYRCAACGFEAQRYFWQCPGCLNWDSYPPQRIEDL